MRSAKSHRAVSIPHPTDSLKALFWDYAPQVASTCRTTQNCLPLTCKIDSTVQKTEILASYRRKREGVQFEVRLSASMYDSSCHQLGV